MAFDTHHLSAHAPTPVLTRPDTCTAQVRFENVDVVAPGGTCCVSGLTFTVKPNEPLIVTGPNGSGKSSLFRVLGGLWEIPEGGCVYRPCKSDEADEPGAAASLAGSPSGDAGDATALALVGAGPAGAGAGAGASSGGGIEVFLVPQKPYHSNGSLADQITYPHHIPAEQRTLELERKLLDLLRLVEVENLVERWSWQDARILEAVPVAAAAAAAGVVRAYKYAHESSFTRRDKLRRGAETFVVEVTEDDLAAERAGSRKAKIRAVAKKTSGRSTALMDLGAGDRVKLLAVTTDEATGEVRYSGWDRTQKWEDVLSLGEQQRIGCARLFYHSPKFAVLDECTSAVSIDVEKKLYEAASDHNITSITISQRLALEEFHTHELQLGDSVSEAGWKLRTIHGAAAGAGAAGAGGGGGGGCVDGE